jgi:hypothetical protein
MKKIMTVVLVACFAFVTKNAFTDDSPAKVENNKSKKDTGSDKVPVKTVMAVLIKPDCIASDGNGVFPNLS